jgi:DNA repair exonuclease SbcCD nuclease subunit
MKLAIINDTHFGARSDSPVFGEYFFKFFDEVFFPYCDKHGIDTVLHLGDLLDRRKFVNFQTLNQVRTRFMEPLLQRGMTVHCILGNHDVYYKNTNLVNSPKELFGERYTNFIIYEEPIELQFGSLRVAMVPWINKNNHEDFLRFIKKSKCPVICGHFELEGYQVLRGVKFEGGMPANLLARYEMVLSGHFHHKHGGGNVQYLGTQYQITFSDLEDRKGFHVLDTETRELEFVENPNKMFHAIRYDDSRHDYSKLLENADFSRYANTFVKVFVDAKTKPYVFDKFLDGIYTAPAMGVTIVEQNPDTSTGEPAADMALDTLGLINKEIDGMEEVHDKSMLKRIVRDLYMESLSL